MLATVSLKKIKPRLTTTEATGAEGVLLVRGLAAGADWI